MRKNQLLVYTIFIFISCNISSTEKNENEKLSHYLDSVKIEREIEDIKIKDTLNYLYKKYDNNLDTSIFKMETDWYSKFLSSDFQNLKSGRIIIINEYIIIDVFYKNDNFYLSLEPFIITSGTPVEILVSVSEKSIEKIRKLKKYPISKNPIILKIKQIYFSESILQDKKWVSIQCDLIEYIDINQKSSTLDDLKNDYRDKLSEPEPR